MTGLDGAVYEIEFNFGKIIGGKAREFSETKIHHENEFRLALVIGNGGYNATLGKLTNPPNDAELISQTLGQLGFKVIKVIDGSQKQMKRAIKDF